MAESDYLNLIAQGLKAYHDAGYMAEFDAKIPDVYLGDFDYQKFYSMMGWYGLDKTKAFEATKLDKVWYDDYNTYIKAPSVFGDTKDCK